jgi:UDP-N-acetylmuramate--alanine ligase
MGELDRTRRVHIVGVGGAGMSALAKLLAARDLVVTGSDLRASESLIRLEELGLTVWAGHRPEEAARADLVVASSAVPDSDPELAAAAAAGARVWRRPELLAALTAEVPTVGPTGTHGKTSSAGMMVAALRAIGRDPSFVVGGELVDLRTNAAVGTDDLLVLEVDEAFGTFEHVHLRGLQVTNVEAEHLEYFASFAELERAFERVARKVAGPVVASADDPGARRLAERTSVATYGTDPAATWRIGDVVLEPWSVRFRLDGPEGGTRVEIPRPGLHVARNAAGALALLASLGFDLAAAAEGLAAFHGVKRRFELRGTVAGVTVVDDYAHHPTEVAATLTAARRVGPGTLWAVFQPHLFSRTERLHREFGEALALADRVVVTDVYGSREAPRPGVTGELVAAAARSAGARDVHYVAHRSDLAGFVSGGATPGDLVVTMGAGDITLVPAELLAILAAGDRR